MALVSYKCTGAAAPGEQGGANNTIPVVSQVNTVKTATALVVTDAVAVAAAIAVLVADGASPTQAHVTTLNTAYTTLAAAITAADAAAGTAQTAATGALTVTIDAVAFPNMDYVTRALRFIERQCFSSGVYPNP